MHHDGSKAPLKYNCRQAGVNVGSVHARAKGLAVQLSDMEHEEAGTPLCQSALAHCPQVVSSNQWEGPTQDPTSHNLPQSRHRGLVCCQRYAPLEWEWGPALRGQWITTPHTYSTLMHYTTSGRPVTAHLSDSYPLALLRPPPSVVPRTQLLLIHAPAT
jgi:hypothetical protein